MQPIKILSQWLIENLKQKKYLFRASDLKMLFPNLSAAAFKTLLSRAEDSGLLVRVCRGLYFFAQAMPKNDGLLLFHAAAALRSQNFNYISLETALSAVGVISQAPLNWVTIVSSGRSNIITCGRFGTIEFVHTTRKPAELQADLLYDADCHMWRANVKLALKDMKIMHRNCDLIDWEAVNELV